MILNNLKNYLKMMALTGAGPKDSLNSTVVDCIYPIVNTSGTTVTSFYTVRTTSSNNVLPFYRNYFSVSTSATKQGTSEVFIVLGTGTTPVAGDDYFIESIIDSNIDYGGTSSNTPVWSTRLDADNNKCIAQVSMTIPVKNTGTTDLTVTEAGLYQGVYRASGTYNPVLFHREVFDPVTIPAGGIRSFNFDFEFVTQLA